MKYFLTGGAGFLGYHITKKLLALGHEVVIYDNFLNFIDPLVSHYPFYLNYRLNDLKNKVQIIRGDVRNRGSLVKALKETMPEIVIHLAAIPLANVSNQHSEEAIQINLNGTITVLESLRAVGIKRFIYTSSSFVYGNFQHDPADEEHPTNPIDLYGGTKLCGETLTKVFGKRFGIDYTIIRPSAVYGPTDCNMRVSQLFVENALLNKPLTVDNDGGAVDFTYVEDTAEGFILASLSNEAKNQTYNITAGRGKTAKEYANEIAQYFTIKMIEKNSDVIRPKRGALNVTKAFNHFNYSPNYNLAKGIHKYIEFVQQCGVLNGK